MRLNLYMIRCLTFKKKVLVRSNETLLNSWPSI